jgi:hypothetical protein
VVPQVLAYQALPTAGLMYGAGLADDLHRRVGETYDQPVPTHMQGETFVRVKGWTGGFAGNDGRPSFDQNLWFMQVGLGVATPAVIAPGDVLRVDAILSRGGSDVVINANRAKFSFAATSVGATTTYQSARGGMSMRWPWRTCITTRMSAPSSAAMWAAPRALGCPARWRRDTRFRSGSA